MRFLPRPGGLASLTLAVRSLDDTAAFWRGVLRPLGYGRVNAWSGSVLWASNEGQILVQEAPEPSSHVTMILRAPSRDMVDTLHAAAVAQGWPVKQPPEPRPRIASGYYDCVLAVPGAEGIWIAVAHAWDDLPERADARSVTAPDRLEKSADDGLGALGGGHDRRFAELDVRGDGRLARHPQ